MDNLKKLPEAKYVMDDLMKRTLSSEEKLILQKKKTLHILKKIIQDISLLQLQMTGMFCVDMDQIRKKERVLENLIKLIDMNI